MVFINLKMSERYKYEAFLKNEFGKLPHFTKDELSKIPKPDRPDMAAFQNYYMTIDPKLRRVPVEKLAKAYRQTKTLEKKYRQKRTAPLLWEEQAANTGGRTRGIMYDPNDP